MPPKEHRFERTNAAQWDTESNVSTAPSTAPSTAQLHGAGSGQAPPRFSALIHHGKPFQTPQPNTIRGTPLTQLSPSGEIPSGNAIPRPQPAPVNAYATGSDENLRPQGQSRQRQGNTYNPGSQRQSQKLKNAWAVTPDLVTTRKAVLNSEEALKQTEFEALRTRPDSNDAFAATGYYLWPKGSKDPMDLFDPTLKAFDKLRVTYKVHIDWNDKMRCLRINCNARGAVQNVADAIQGIKVLQRHAQAQVISASPEYIIVPPTPDAMRSIVRPGAWGDREHCANRVVERIELAGDPFSLAEKMEWQYHRHQMNEENYEKFRKHLIDRTIPLGDLMGWMRMRVHFGHVNLSQYQDAFAAGMYTFDLFCDMMKKNRVATGGTFDRKMDAAIAMNLIKKIIGRVKEFCPRSGKISSLDDVLADPKHTEIIFVTTPDGLNYRLEAEIESVESEAAGNFQIGQTRLFANDRRNKRMEITTIDPHLGFDWTVEIIQDGEVKEIPGVLKQYIAASLDLKSEKLVDPLGLSFPAITLRAPTEFIVHGVIMRSVFQYMWLHTGNVVEIAIYREWDSEKTTPHMQASVSMFNPDWDSEMASMEDHTEGRNWDAQLHNFFGKDGVSHLNTGLKGLVHEIREVQGLLSEAAKAHISVKEPAALSGATTPSEDGFLV